MTREWWQTIRALAYHETDLEAGPNAHAGAVPGAGLSRRAKVFGALAQLLAFSSDPAAAESRFRQVLAVISQRRVSGQPAPPCSRTKPPLQ